MNTSSLHWAICPLSVVPVRSGSHHRSEQVTQLLFGDLAEVVERKGRVWVKIRCQNDNTIGWVLTNQLQAITPSEFERFQEGFAYNLALLHPVMANNTYLPIPMGARLPDFDGLHFHLGDQTFTFSGQAVFPSELIPTAVLVEKVAKRLLNAPYQWGGRSPLGIDAGGLTQLVFQMVGIQLHREPDQQVHQGEPIDFVDEAKPGDLAFFEDKKGRIDHVGIVLPNQKIIHVHDCVRIDTLDHYGIYDSTQQKYSHPLRLIRRLLPETPPEGTPAQQKATQIAAQYELFK
jgi:hypothetical protein